MTDTANTLAKTTGREANAIRPRIQPLLDAYETADGLHVVLDMPGVDAGDLEIGFEDSVLTIEGKTSPSEDSRRYLHRDFRPGDFYRTLRVGDQVDAERIGADYANGVLTIHLPKSSAARPRKITVT